MLREEKPFTARWGDQQFDQLAQATSKRLDTPNHQVVESLQILYSKQMQQEQQSLERMRQRLALSVADKQQKQQEKTD